MIREIYKTVTEISPALAKQKCASFDFVFDNETSERFWNDKTEEGKIERDILMEEWDSKRRDADGISRYTKKFCGITVGIGFIMKKK